MIKEFLNNNIRGILGTVIFHLILFIMFLMVKIKEFKEDYNEFIVIDFQQPEIPKEKKFNINLAEIIPELKAQNRKNTAVNVAEDFKKQISTEEYYNELKKEYNIDPEEGWKEKLEEKYSLKNDDNGDQKEFSNPDIKPEETNVTYSIENRFARYIHVPVYKCKGRATVVVEIGVDNKGNVASASINSGSTNTSDACFHEEAIAAARRSRFNADYSAPARQKGSITFKFVAQ